MSFDLGILSGAQRLDPDQAREAYERLGTGTEWSSVLAADDRARSSRRAPLTRNLPTCCTWRVSCKAFDSERINALCEGRGSARIPSTRRRCRAGRVGARPGSPWSALGPG